ncbi:MAG TPA: cytochrome P450 [Micromonosporaceae bacterium]|nr:cytochrome P450 [Micromonosporaceae bacterium]HCU48328.1 cytochrome P450 [Micromonosporaceae bacterium]
MDLKTLLSEEGRTDPFSLYAVMHRDGKAARLGPKDGYAVAVYGYDAVAKVLRDHRFGQLDAAYLDVNHPQWRRHPALVVLRESMFFSDSDAHDRMRQRIGRFFTPRRMSVLEPVVAQLTETMLDRLDEHDGPVDFMAEFAYLLPSSVMAEVLGVPHADLGWFRPRVLAIGAILELDGATWSNMARADMAAKELMAYFTDLVAARRAQPQDDLISELSDVDDAELIPNLITTFNAGFVTTTHLLGNGLTMLLDRPELRDRSVVDEILRFEPPVQIVARYALEDAEIEDLAVRAGEAVLVMLGAANRDPRRFPDPDRFDPDRPNNVPLSFGLGPHYCLGAALSKIEAEIAFPALFKRFPRLTIVTPSAPVKPLILRGHDTLMVTTR